MKHILVCMTGGTFSSVSEKSVMRVSEQANQTFRQKIEAKYKTQIEFEYCNPVFILSENLVPKNWTELTDGINKALEKQPRYDGIIVIHGSDTAPYTTAFLSYYYDALPIPIVVTASNAPIDEAHANGWNNFFASVDFILSDVKTTGVYFVFQSRQNQGDIFVYAADEIREADIYSDEFSSSMPIVYGVMKAGHLITRGTRYKPIKTEKWSFDPFIYKNSILGIKPYPGLDYRVFDLKGAGIKAVVHQSYHSNTHNCTMEKDTQDYSLFSFIETCKALGISVYLSDFPRGRMIMPLYETTIKLIREGAIPLYLPFEAAYTKAVYAYNQKGIDIETFMMR